MSKRQANWWLLGYTPREASYGAGVANGSLDKWFKTDEPVILDFGGEEQTDENEIKGYVGVSEDGIDVVKERGEITITTRPNLQLLGFLIKAILGDTSSATGGSDPYTHTLNQQTTAVIRPHSTSIITGEDRATAATQWKHDGVVPSSIRISWTQDNPAGELSFTLVTDGDPTDASAVTPPALATALKGDRVRFEHLAATLGAQGAGASITSILRSVEITIEADLQEEQRASRGTALGTVFHGPNAPKVSVKLVVEGQEGDTRWDFWDARTVLEFALVGTISASRTFTLDVGACYIPKEVGKIADIENGIIQVLNLPLELMWENVDTRAFQFVILNDVAAYLAAS